MKDWLVPPIVIAFVLVVTLAAYALFRVHFSQRYHSIPTAAPPPLVRPFSTFLVSTPKRAMASSCPASADNPWYLLPTLYPTFARFPLMLADFERTRLRGAPR